MKLTLNQIDSGEEELILRYYEKTEKIQEIIQLASGEKNRILGYKNNLEYPIEIKNILYIESVDRGTFAYLEKDVYKISYSLHHVQMEFALKGLFRCSKSMIINLHQIKSLCSLGGNRIDATLENGEHVIISRKYAKALKEELRGDRDETSYKI